MLHVCAMCMYVYDLKKISCNLKCWRLLSQNFTAVCVALLLFIATVNFRMNLLCEHKKVHNHFSLIYNVHGRWERERKKSNINTQETMNIFIHIYYDSHSVLSWKAFKSNSSSNSNRNIQNKKWARKNIITNNINWLILNWKWNLLVIFLLKCLFTKCYAFTILLSVCAVPIWLIVQYNINQSNISR